MLLHVPRHSFQGPFLGTSGVGATGSNHDPPLSSFLRSHGLSFGFLATPGMIHSERMTSTSSSAVRRRHEMRHGLQQEHLLATTE